MKKSIDVIEAYAFRVAMHETIGEAAIEKTKKLNLVLQTKDGELPPVSLSIGVAFGNEHDDTDSLFKKADKALYQTKRDGRNGVTVFGSENKENRISENE